MNLGLPCRRESSSVSSSIGNIIVVFIMVIVVTIRFITTTRGFFTREM